MGLLDEAIRQHLELKRQHGASDEELQMQEQEALGPVRREPAEPVAASLEELEPSLEQDVGEPYEGAPVEGGADVPVYDEALEEPVEEAPFEPPDDAFHEPLDPYAEPTPGEPDGATDTLRPEHDVEPGPSDDTPSEGFDAVQEPVEADAGVPYAGEEEEEGEDVLEETPEFLQETPEHDRLWFEQKPPRDFDFDE